MKRWLWYGSIVVLVVILVAPVAFADLPSEGAGEVEVPRDEPPEPAVDQDVRDWEFAAVPYIFLPFMAGEAGVGGITAEVDTTISDLFTRSDFVFALAAQIESWYRRKWGLAFNGMWTVLEKDDVVTPGPVPIEFDIKVNMGYAEFLGLYSFGERPFGPEPGSST
jgi:hypothetical protein